MKYSKCLLVYLSFAMITPFIWVEVKAQNTSIHWQKIANGVWKTEVGKPEKTSQLNRKNNLGI